MTKTSLKLFDFNPENALGKPLVNLAYANGFPPQIYRAALEPLFKDYHVISLHARPLWGDSAPAPESLTSWEQLGNDLLAALDGFTDQPVIGIGHSVGGVATLFAAVKRPDRFSRLVLIEPTLLAPHLLWAMRLLESRGNRQRRGLVEGALRRRSTWKNTDEAYQYFKGKRLFARWPDEVLREYVTSLTAPGADGNIHLTWSPEWEAQIYRTLITDGWKLPRRLKPPTLVIRGNLSDTFTTASALTFRLLNPRARMALVHGAGHLVPQEQPAAVGQLIVDFVRSNT